jgi:chitin synthase
MGLLTIIGLLMGAVGFLTFGFQNTVCGKPPAQFKVGQVDTNSVIIYGHAYNLAKFNHPAAGSTFGGNTNPLNTPGFAVAGADVSFMFQKVNGTCDGIITASTSASVIPSTNGNPHWYFPCNPFPQQGVFGPNVTNYDSAFQCHATSHSRQLLNGLSPSGLVSYSWQDVINGPRKLAVFES